MERHEIDAELGTDGARALLATSIAHLAYVGPDDAPRVVPVGFWWTGEQIVVSTATTSPKVPALSARPAVALTIDIGDTPTGAKTLSIRGVADIEIVDGVVEEYLLAARQSMGDDAAAFEANVRAFYPQMARIAITPTWARFYDYGTGRVPQFLQDLAAQAGLAEG